MRTRCSTLTIAIFTALMASAVHAQNVDVQAQLMQQGQYWQERSDSPRAAEAWQKVLRLDPGQVDALYGMGLAGVRQNQPEQARVYLARLQALSPVPWQARQLEQDIAMMAPENKALLDEARRLVVAGERGQATEVFRKIFAGRSPEGSIGHEFYNNLAYIPSGWPEARRGMERLMRQWPDDVTLALSYARQLIHYENSRAQGVRLLAQLSKRTDIGGAADESWRLALIWTGPPKASMVPLFEEFLRAHPDDQEIRALMHKGRQQVAGTAHNPLVASGLRALERGDQVSAEKAFEERLAAQPNDRDALGGLGVVRQQQSRYGEAEQLLRRAISKGGRQWQSALDSVRYWSLLEQARDLQANGQTLRAEDLVAQAMRLNPRPVDGRLTLADIQALAGKFDHARANYRQVLAAQPGNAQAIRGLIDVLSQTGQVDEALRLLDSLSAEEQARFGNQAQLRSLHATQQATMAEQRNDLQGARDALSDALTADPDNVWTRFRLARLYVSMGEPQKARELLDRFVAAYPDNAEALYTSALLLVELEEWAQAQRTINRIPAAQRSAEMDALASQIMLTMQTQQALTLARSGQRRQALALLDHLSPMAAGSTGRTATLASAYADVGEIERAHAMMRTLVAQASTPSNELMLHYAAVLLKTGEDVEVYTILTELQYTPMGTATRKHYDDLLYAYRLRQAERLRESGDLATAYDMLAPALVQRPGDVAAISALARMYMTNGDHTQALTLYKPLVQRHPQDADVLLGAANAAVLAQARTYANKTLDQFVKLHKTDPAALTEAARIYRAMGRNKEAATLLRKAIAIEQGDQHVPGVPGGGGNPFLDHWAQHAQTMRTVMAAVPPPAATFLNGGQIMAVAHHEVPRPAPVYQDTRRHPARSSDVRPQMASSATPMTIEQNNLHFVEIPRSMLSSVASVAIPAAVPSTTRYVTGSTAQAMSVDDDISPAQRALDDLQRSRAASLTQGLSVRSNNNEAGLSRLTDAEVPLAINMPAGNGRLVVGITPVSLDAGRLNNDLANSGSGLATRFGIGLLAAEHVEPQRATGVGFSVGYVLPAAGFKIDLGTTPSGFEYQNVVGGVSVERALKNAPNVHYGLVLSRRAVTDSLISFAGTRITHDRQLLDGIDVALGTALSARSLAWGGVTANGGRIQMGFDDLDAGIYGYGALHTLRGHNVKSNTRVEFGGGAYRYLRSAGDNTLTIGLSAQALHYANNQNFYTYGHGGYFSPQSYVSFGVPVAWARRAERFSYQLKGSAGLQYLRTDGADYFPNDPLVQSIISDPLLVVASGVNPYYAEWSSKGFSYNMEAAGEYRFTPRAFVGGRFALDNSRDYRQYDVGMYIRYFFENMDGKPLALPVSPYRSPYSN